MRLIPLATVAVLVFPQLALAEPYIAGSLSQSRWPDGGCQPRVSCDRNDTSGSVRAGYRFSPWISLEGRYFDLGKLSRTISEQATIEQSGGTITSPAVRDSYGVRGAGINVVASWPLTESFSVGAVAGVAAMRTTVDFTSSLPSETLSVEYRENHTRPYYGLRASYAWSRESDVSLEFERYDAVFSGGSSKVDTLGIAVSYRF